VGGRLSVAAADPGPVRPANKQGPGNRPGNRQGFKLTATVPVDHYDA
jgi:hypothetical protein